MNRPPEQVAQAMSDPLITGGELAAMIRRPPGTIRQWRHNGYGPRGFKVGGRVVYRLSEVQRWLAEQERAEQASA